MLKNDALSRSQDSFIPADFDRCPTSMQYAERQENRFVSKGQGSPFGILHSVQKLQGPAMMESPSSISPAS